VSSEQRGGTQRPNHRLACTYQIAQWAPPGVVIEAKDIELSPIVRGWTRRGHRVVVGIRELNHPHAIGIHVRAPRRRRVSTCIDTLHGRTTNEAQGTRHKTAVCLSVCLSRQICPGARQIWFGPETQKFHFNCLSIHTRASWLFLLPVCIARGVFIRFIGMHGLRRGRWSRGVEF